MERLEHDVESFLFSKEGPIYDVRSPCEFIHGHIPGSHSLPLFSDEERHLVGLCYKQKGKKEAMLLGLSFVGPKMAVFSEQFAQLENVRLLCFRGGLRSSSMAWLAQFIGAKVVRLAKGYKSYRKWVLDTVKKPFSPLILAGPTGSGKTELIELLVQKGYPTLDLEGLAHHRGSVFGGFEDKEQPSQEFFENKLAHALHPLFKDPYVCVEAESRSIGRIVLPQNVYDTIHSGPILSIECPFEERLCRVVSQYGNKPQALLIQSIEKLKQRMGSQATREAMQFVECGRLHDAAALLLHYYDKTYEHCITRHKGLRTTISRKEILDVISEGRFEEFARSLLA